MTGPSSSSTGRAGIARMRRSLLVMSAVILIAAGVVGCSDDAPMPTTPTDAITAPPDTSTATPSPTPTPPSAAYVASPPQSAAQAIDDAAAAYNQYLYVAGTIYANPEDSSAIDDIARGGAAEFVHDSAQIYLESGASVQFFDTFEVNASESITQAITSADGVENEFGQAHLLGCYDVSSRTGTNVDGSPIATVESSRILATVNAEYDSSLERWFITHDQPAFLDSETIPC